MFKRFLIAAALLSASVPAASAEEVFQISTHSNLAIGAFDGAMSIKELLTHGNFGLGTFDKLDGEMMVLDGQVYRAGIDGRVNQVAPRVTTPFAVVVPFKAQKRMLVPEGLNQDAVLARMDNLPLNAARIYAVRIDGNFQSIKVRSEPAQNKPYRPIADVLREQQVSHNYENITGTLVGFRFPKASASVNNPGWHFHFVSADRKIGGHVLGFVSGHSVAAIQENTDLKVRFPDVTNTQVSQEWPGAAPVTVAQR